MGVVTTTRVQHASPSGTYAHTVNRDWYSDADMPQEALRDGCQDIASQLISNVDIDVGIRQGRVQPYAVGSEDILVGLLRVGSWGGGGVSLGQGVPQAQCVWGLRRDQGALPAQ